MQTEKQKKLIEQYCNGEITGEEFTEAIDKSTKARNDDILYRYSLYERRDLNSKILWNGTNKAEMKKVRTGWKYQILLPTVTTEIYDNVKKEWVV